MLEQDKTKPYVLNTPSNVKLNLLFNINSDINKAAFLLHQINFCTPTGGYYINIRKHDWLFGNGGTTSRILKTLLKEKIITPVGGYSVSNTSTKFKMVNPFKIKKGNINNDIYECMFFDREDKKLPIFLKKWLADDYTIKDSSTTNYNKLSKDVKVISEANIVDELKMRVQQLEEENKGLKKQIEEFSIQKIENEIITSANELITGTTINNLVKVNNEFGVKNSIINTEVQSLEVVKELLKSSFGSPAFFDTGLFYERFSVQKVDNQLELHASYNEFEALKKSIEETLVLESK